MHRINNALQILVRSRPESGRPNLQKFSMGHMSQTFREKKDFGFKLLLLRIIYKATKNEGKCLLHSV